MYKKLETRFLALLLAAVMLIGMVPLSAIAAEDLSVSNYTDFVSQLKVLETYAKDYAKTSGKDANELIVNFIRTGVDRYNDGNWKTLAGEEITEFTAYVENQDVRNNTTAMALRNIIIDDFKLPNGNAVDFGHMFGTLNIAYVASQQTADLGGWAGDICDLMLYSRDYGSVPAGTIEEMAKYIRENCFGVDADDAFGMDDFYGDMDAFYINKQAKAGVAFSKIFEEYFTADLSDSDRAAYFLNNRFSGLLTREQVRTAIYNQYNTNVGLRVLEASRDLSDEADLRYACCYAFADYLFDLAGDKLTGGEDSGDSPSEDRTYKVFSTENSTLAPGITQSINYALNKNNSQFMYYMASIDVTRSDVIVTANYKDNDPSKGWGMQKLTDQMSAAQKNHSDPSSSNYMENYTPIAGINADFYNMSNGKPSGTLVMNGTLYNGGGGNFFGILKDGTPIIGGKDEWNTYKDEIQEAVGGSIILIKDGEIVPAEGSYYTTEGTRSVVGITADGKVIFLVIDGRQAPMSVGATVEETAQILLDAGCVAALHLDGGGSATYASKAEGSDTVKVVNNPSDGYERSVSSTLIAVSTAKLSNEFDHANIYSDYDYLTIDTKLNMSASGVSGTGNTAALPADCEWTVSDATVGTISQDGVFTAVKNGKVDVMLVSDGEIVGTKTLYVVVPDALAFTKENFNVVYDVSFEIPLQATYEGKKVKINPSDVVIAWEYEDNATVDGFTMTVNDDSGIRSMLIAAMLANNIEYDEDDNPTYIMCMASISMYYSDEAYFDFDNVTAGNRTLAWLRKILNAKEENGGYHVIDPKKDMTIEYTFGLDMTKIEIPAQLADLTYMLPGAEDGATAWQFLLQLAERVSVLSEVSISMTFNKNLEVDYSELALSTEFFNLKNATLDESTNTLTVTFGWIDRTMAVDPATANPIVIFSGLKLTPKKGTAWIDGDVLEISNVGEVSYKIYLRANALYSFATNEENQQNYGLHPFVNPDVIVEGNPERGAYFGSTYADFEDSFKLDNSDRSGWISEDNELTYWVNNEKLTGLQYLPYYEDPTQRRFYNLDENGVCIGLANGLLTYKGDLYFAINGEITTGWRPMTNSDGEKVYYYFAAPSGKAVDGEQVIGGYHYVFKDNLLVRGELVKHGTSVWYMWAGSWSTQQWMTIDGKEYYFRSNYAAATGLYTFAIGGVQVVYLFDENGAWLSDYTGIYDNGTHSFYIENGIKVNYPGLVKIGEDYYYFRYCEGNILGPMAKNGTYWITKTNGIVKEGNYAFDSEGKMINPPAVDQTPEQKPTDPEPTDPTPSEPTPTEPVKNGIVAENDSLYYYKDGELYYAGLIVIDGNYYYVKTSGEVIHGKNYWITKTNGLLPEKSYTFDEDGKIVFETTTPDPEPTDPTPTEPTPSEPVKNGIVEENGSLYYYQNGKLCYAGLIEIDGSYYYVKTSGEVIHGKYYWITKTNGLMPERGYTFDEDGKMIDPEIIDMTKDGIVEENGSLYYYKNGLHYYAGLIEIDGSYYYVKTNGEVVHGRSYWISKTNGLLMERSYIFAEDGRILDAPAANPLPDPDLKQGIVEEDGSLYYYLNGLRSYAGLIEIDGSYYYVKTNGEVIHGRTYWITKTNGLLPEDSYTFGEDGKLIQE